MVTLEAMFDAEPVENPLGGVPLLGGAVISAAKIASMMETKALLRSRRRLLAN